MIQPVPTATQYASNFNVNANANSNVSANVNSNANSNVHADGYLPDNRLPQLKTQPLHRPIPAPEPDPEPNPGPDAITRLSGGIISATDWDELFHAVQVRLEQCVSNALDKQPELALQHRHELTKVAVLQCVDAMKQLHQSLTLERQQSIEQQQSIQQQQSNQQQQSQQHPQLPQYQ